MAHNYLHTHYLHPPSILLIFGTLATTHYLHPPSILLIFSTRAITHYLHPSSILLILSTSATVWVCDIRVIGLPCALQYKCYYLHCFQMHYLHPPSPSILLILEFLDGFQ
jgi:hypothetical protein